MTLKQMALYLEPERQNPAEVFRTRRDYYLDQLRQRLVAVGREVPADLAEWPDEPLNKLWLELKGEDGVQAGGIVR